MSAATTKVLATAVGAPLCEVAVIGVKPDGSLHIDWTGTTLGSLLLLLELAKREAMTSWDEGRDAHVRKGIAA